MWNLSRLLAVILFTSLLGAQAPMPTPQILPGEALAISVNEEPAKYYGEASREHPMGSLAKLVWLRLEGEEWAASGLEFKCTGTAGSDTCWLKKGHGRLDLQKALQQSCNLAFLNWARLSAEEWKRYMGEGVGRLHLEEGFRPFLGSRLPPGDTLPPLTPAWVGDGDLLRTSPEAMLQWLMDPTQTSMISTCRRYLAVRIGKDESWWVKTGTAPVVGEPGATSAWVAGGNGQIMAVLHLPRGKGKVEGLERFQQVMGLK